jgi:hypothetical protein
MNATKLRELQAEFADKEEKRQQDEADATRRAEAEILRLWIEEREKQVSVKLQELEQALTMAASTGGSSVRVELPHSNKTYTYPKESDPVYLAYVKYAEDNDLKWEFDTKRIMELGYDMEQTNVVSHWDHFMVFTW